MQNHVVVTSNGPMATPLRPDGPFAEPQWCDIWITHAIHDVAFAAADTIAAAADSIDAADTIAAAETIAAATRECPVRGYIKELEGGR